MNTAVLISIGDELLAGNTIDTNSNFIAKELRLIGIKVVKILTISDEKQSITTALEEAFRLAPLVISTGGLGPTKDDKTKQVITSFFNDELRTDAATLRHLEQWLQERGKEHLLSINHGQAEVPSRATVIQNDYGTAPCLLMQDSGRVLFVLPGVPYEVKPLVKEKILPYLAERYQRPHILTRVISVVDFPESLLSRVIENWELALPSHLQLAYLPIGNRVKLKLTANGQNKEALERDLDLAIAQLEPLISHKAIA